MIKQAKQANHQEIMEYLNKEPVINTMIIADIDNNGYDNENVRTFIQYQEDKIIAIFLKYFKTILIYSQEAFLNLEFINYLKSLDPTLIMGKKSLVDQLLNEIEHIEARDCYFCEIPLDTKLDNFVAAEPLDPADIKEFLLASYSVFNENSGSDQPTFSDKQIQKLKKELLNGKRLTYVIKEDNKIVSSSSSNTITDKSACITGVFTLPQYRNKNYATRATLTLVQELQKRKVIGNLFYDNPKAGKIYLKMGFKQSDTYWGMLQVKKI
ncbi:MAG: GNAT family N-acetyltransferase [Erysipelotrichaceae bacterium]